MQYQVPQFIEVEDKMFGPFTFKQVIYMIGGIGLSYLLYRFTPSIIVSGLPIIIIMTLSAALAFYRVNNRPFISVMESAFRYAWNAKLYLWKKTAEKPVAAEKKSSAMTGQNAAPATNYASITVPKVSSSKLKDIAWNLDIHENLGEPSAKR